MDWLGLRRVLKRGEQLTVQVGVGVQATTLIARMSSGSIGETAARFLDQKDPWRVIPDVVSLGQEGIDFATNKLDECERACGYAGPTLWEAGSGRVVQSIEPSVSQNRSGADFEAFRFGILAGPGRLERTAASARPPAASQRWSGDDSDLCAPGNIQRNMHSPVRITPTEERRAVNRVYDPDPIGLTESTKLLAEERIVWSRRRQRLAKQSLDCPIGFRDWCPVGLQRYRNARLEIGERKVRCQVRSIEGEF